MVVDEPIGDRPGGVSADGATVWAGIAAQARARPDAPAIRTADAVWSYKRFCDGAERVASGLQRSGVSRGDRVLIMGNSCVETCVVWLACHRLGATACMLNGKAQGRELVHAARLLAPKAIVGSPEQLDLATELLDEPGHSDVRLMIGYRRGTTGISIEDLVGTPIAAIDEPRPDDVSEVLFTSGTTSLPKAVEVTSGRLLEHWLEVSRHYQLSSDDVGYMVTPIHHQSAIRHVGLICWLTGAEVYIPDGFHPRRIWSEISTHGVSYTCMVDAMFRILLSLPESADETGHKLRLVIGIGNPALAEQCEARYGFETVHVYGSTETGAPVAARVGMSAEERARYRHALPGARFCGWPLAGNSVWIEHEDAIHAENALGEIVVSSSGGATGYVAVATDSPDTDGVPDRGFRTGDRGMVGPDGAIYFAGRAEEIIRRAGENISALEIEAVLTEHPDVADVAVVGVPDPIREEEVKAFVIPRRADLEPSELRLWLEEQLSLYKVPRFIDLCAEFPMTVSGKINKSQLSQGKVVVLKSFDVTR